MVLQLRADCSVGEISFAVQLLFVDAAFLIVEIDALTLDPFKFVYLHVECVHIGYNAGVP